MTFSNNVIDRTPVSGMDYSYACSHSLGYHSQLFCFSVLLHCNVGVKCSILLRTKKMLGDDLLIMNP